MIEFELRNYLAEDFEFVLEAKRVCYGKYIEHYFGEWNEAEQRKLYSEFLEANEKYLKIVLCGGEKAGFINGNINDDGEYFQGNICLLPKFQGKGIGTKILSDAISENAGRDVRLRVFKINPAKNLYERLGFRVVDETASHFIMIRKADQKDL